MCSLFHIFLQGVDRTVVEGNDVAWATRRRRRILQSRILFILYRKFLKLSEIVYNKHESKNDMTKERRGDFATTLFMLFYWFVWWLHYLTIEKWLL